MNALTKCLVVIDLDGNASTRTRQQTIQYVHVFHAPTLFG